MTEKATHQRSNRLIGFDFYLIEKVIDSQFKSRTDDQIVVKSGPKRSPVNDPTDSIQFLKHISLRIFFFYIYSLFIISL